MPPGDGTDATAAGMTVVLGTTLANTIDTELTKSRDYIANGPLYWKPGVVCSIAKGGTGATSAAAARTALGITATNVPSAAGSNVQTDLTFLGSRIDGITASSIPSAGGSTVQGDLNYLGLRIDSAEANANSRVSRAGDTMTGNLYLPASSAATSGYTIAYINGDGRVSRGASSIRFKDLLEDPDVADLGAVFPPLREFTMKHGDGKPTLGHIAEELAAEADTERFVVYETQQAEDGSWQVWRDAEGNPVPLSIDFTSLLLTQTARLHYENEQLRAALADLLGRVEALEGE